MIAFPTPALLKYGNVQREINTGVVLYHCGPWARPSGVDQCPRCEPTKGDLDHIRPSHTPQFYTHRSLSTLSTRHSWRRPPGVRLCCPSSIWRSPARPSGCSSSSWRHHDAPQLIIQLGDSTPAVCTIIAHSLQQIRSHAHCACCATATRRRRRLSDGFWLRRGGPCSAPYAVISCALPPPHAPGAVEESLQELARLARTAGLFVVGSASQMLNAPAASTYLGSGKLADIAEDVEAHRVDTVIFDDELSPGQQRNLERALGDGVRVADRTALILDIFAQRARTKEGQLQARPICLRLPPPPTPLLVVVRLYFTPT